MVVALPVVVVPAAVVVVDGLVPVFVGDGLIGRPPVDEIVEEFPVVATPIGTGLVVVGNGAAPDGEVTGTIPAGEFNGALPTGMVEGGTAAGEPPTSPELVLPAFMMPIAGTAAFTRGVPVGSNT